MKELLLAFGLIVLFTNVHLYTVIDSEGNEKQVDKPGIPSFPDIPPRAFEGEQAQSEDGEDEQTDPKDDEEEIDQIVGGSIVRDIRTFPYMAALFLNGGLCGGTLYRGKYIITAAHCLEGQPQSNAARFTVLLNSTSLRGSPGYITVGVSKFVLHPLYNPTSMNYDVAIMALSRQINLPSVRIPLSCPVTFADDYAAVVGWGTTSSGGSISYDLRRATVRVWNNTYCGTRYGTGTNGINRLKLCASYPGRDTCQGDSGGPILVRGVQVGITSYGIGCADSYYPGVYARITSLAGWITMTVQSF